MNRLKVRTNIRFLCRFHKYMPTKLRKFDAAYLMKLVDKLVVVFWYRHFKHKEINFRSAWLNNKHNRSIWWRSACDRIASNVIMLFEDTNTKTKTSWYNPQNTNSAQCLNYLDLLDYAKNQNSVSFNFNFCGALSPGAGNNLSNFWGNILPPSVCRLCVCCLSVSVALWDFSFLGNFITHLSIETM